MTATGLTRKSLVVDGNNILTRAVFAAKSGHRHLHNEDGVPTAALQIFISMLSRYVRQERPDNLVVCWDGGRSEYRSTIFEGYKAARSDAPEDRADRPFGQAKEFLTLAGLHHVERPGVEADDLVASFWRGKHSSERMTILSADKDFLQLIDGWTEQIRPGTGVDERWTANRVRTELKCKPEHLPYVMALTGDSTDGVPGIPGFGPKTAVKALAQHDWSLDALLDDLKVTRLFGRRDDVRRNLDLVNLRVPIPGVDVAYVPRFVPTDVTSLAYPKLVEFLDRYGMERVKLEMTSGSLWKDRVAT